MGFPQPKPFPMEVTETMKKSKYGNSARFQFIAFVTLLLFLWPKQVTFSTLVAKNEREYSCKQTILNYTKRGMQNGTFNLIYLINLIFFQYFSSVILNVICMRLPLNFNHCLSIHCNVLKFSFFSFCPIKKFLYAFYSNFLNVSILPQQQLWYFFLKPFENVLQT